GLIGLERPRPAAEPAGFRNRRLAGFDLTKAGCDDVLFLPNRLFPLIPGCPNRFGTIEIDEGGEQPA
ncbi:MAG: hypothetical protein ACREEP_09105, partial [Dongiaceae bacterium]